MGGTSERCPELGSVGPVGKVTFELELEGHRHSWGGHVSRGEKMDQGTERALDSRV